MFWERALPGNAISSSLQLGRRTQCPRGFSKTFAHFRKLVGSRSALLPRDEPSIQVIFLFTGSRDCCARAVALLLHINVFTCKLFSVFVYLHAGIARFVEKKFLPHATRSVLWLVFAQRWDTMAVFLSKKRNSEHNSIGHEFS